jgi:leukotriene-A4 hydrolase
MCDPHSVSNLDEILSEHIDFNLSFDFTTNVITGYVDLKMRSLKAGVKIVKLDVRTLKIYSVERVNCGDENLFLNFKVYADPEFAMLGDTLEIELNEGVDVGLFVYLRVNYSTSPDAIAAQWLEPEQTLGKCHPYFFTQCQAIHARSLYPCQDAPKAKITYNATLTVPSDLTAVMSAFSRGSKEKENSRTDFYFEQPICIPTYLLAIGIGRLQSKDIGPRSKLWCEGEILEDGAWEFQPTEDFIKAGEELVGEYIWGQYDILLLPPSFPYGGMENPMLTFVTPTLISGDRSNVDVIAHEIAHSWTGNLITNATWEHFWLNEGFTVFLERKIISKISGELHRQLDSVIGFQDLKDSIDQFGESHEFTKLVPNLKGFDPDDAFSSVPYEKGYNFLYYLETLVGGGEVFEPFIKSWIQTHKFQCVTSKDFETFFVRCFPDINVDWDAWLYTPGLPLILNSFDDTLMKNYLELADKWINESEGFMEDDIADFSSTQKNGFLNQLITSDMRFTPMTLLQMDNLYHFSTTKNKENLFRWCKLGLKNNYEKILETTIDFIKSNGRMKYTRELYRDLYNSEIGGEIAVTTFEENKKIYHPICVKMVEHDLRPRT